MTQTQMSFGADSVAYGYDTYLVPAIFDPWADMLLDHLPPQPGSTVLDLATGTGVVACKLAERVGGSGRVIATDVSAEMMKRAREHCKEVRGRVEFIACPAESIPLGENMADTIYCQQGFQFFPDRHAAAAEMRRVLKPGGQLVVTTWLPLERCHFFEAIHDTLTDMNEPDIAAIIAQPFDFMPAGELESCFNDSGFQAIDLSRQSRSMRIEGNVEHAFQTVFGTPIEPQLQAFSQDRHDEFRTKMIARLESLRGCDGVTYGSLMANVVTATKPSV